MSACIEPKPHFFTHFHSTPYPYFLPAAGEEIFTVRHPPPRLSRSRAALAAVRAQSLDPSERRLQAGKKCVLSSSDHDVLVHLGPSDAKRHQVDRTQQQRSHSPAHRHTQHETATASRRQPPPMAVAVVLAMLAE